MKKFLSIILAVVMLVAMVPATFVSAAEGDIAFDFDAWVAANKTGENPLIPARATVLTAENSPEGFAVADGFDQHLKWETSGNSLRIYKYGADWRSSTSNASNRAVMKITVPAGKAGWYQAYTYFTGNAAENSTAAWSLYQISGDSYTYLGDSMNTLKKNLNPVYLSEGVNYVAYCNIGSTTGTYVDNFTFKKIDAEPTYSVVADGVPETIAVGATTDALTATVPMSIGGNYAFPVMAINTSTYWHAGRDTKTYLKIESSNTAVATVSAKTSETVNASENTEYTITGVSEGTATLTFTPVINGVEKTAAATTKTIKVLDKNFNFNFATQAAKYERHTNITADTTLPNFGIADGMEAIIKWDKGAGGMRFYNLEGSWASSTAAKNHPTIKVTVPAEKAGYAYDLYFKYDANAGETGPFSVYHISNGKATYLGDLKPGANPNFRPVVLTEGDNYFAFCAVGKVTVSFIPSMKLTRVEGVPTATSLTADAPESLAIGEGSATYTATVAMSNSKNYQFPQYAINTSDFTKASGNPDSYIKFDVSPADVVAVTATNGGVDNRDKTNYTFTGLKEGTATVTMTPVIAGEEQTALAVTKTVNVIDENIIYDFNAWVPAHTDTIPARGTPLNADNTPAGFGIAAGMENILKWETANNSLRVYDVAAHWTDYNEEKPSVGSRFAMTIDVPAGKAGWYTPEFKYHGNPGQEGLCSVYHIYNGKATYLGNTVNSGANQLAPVYLSEGVNTIAVGVVRGTDGMFINKLAFYKYEGEQATLEAIDVADPDNSLTVGETTDAYEITTTMSDASSLQFPIYAMNTETFYNAGRNYDTYVKVTATPANVVEVDARTYYDYQDKYYYTLTAVGEGDAVLSFVPVVNGVEMTALKQTKTVSVTHPNGQITGDSVSIAVTAVANGVVDAGAKALVSGDLNVGEVNSVVVGSTVTLTAESDENYTFLYWYNAGSKKILSDEKDINITAGTNIAVYAKYLAKDEVLTEYADATGVLVDEDDITPSDKPYKKAGYTLYVDNAEVVNAEEATVTNDAAIYWTKEGEIVGYGTSYTYLKWGNLADPVAVTEGEVSNVPAVVLFESNGAYMLELVNFAGKEIIEKGITFVDGADIYKAVSTTASTQFTAKPFTGGDAQAYVIYRDGAAIRVAYSD